MTAPEPKTGPNKARYRDLMVPFASEEKAKEALAAFMDELMALRTKHRITDCFCIMQVSSLSPPLEEEGETEPAEGTLLVTYHMGDQLRRLPMVAEAYGSEKARFEAAMAKAVSGKSR